MKKKRSGKFLWDGQSICHRNDKCSIRLDKTEAVSLDGHCIVKTPNCCLTRQVALLLGIITEAVAHEIQTLMRELYF